MATLDPEQVTELCADLIRWVEKCKEMELICKDASPEMKEHYSMVYKDYQWRVQNRTGRLWYYVCGAENMNPWKDQEKRNEAGANSSASLGKE